MSGSAWRVHGADGYWRDNDGKALLRHEQDGKQVFLRQLGWCNGTFTFESLDPATGRHLRYLRLPYRPLPNGRVMFTR